MFKWVKAFKRYDPGSKSDEKPNLGELRAALRELISEFFPELVALVTHLSALIRAIRGPMQRSTLLDRCCRCLSFTEPLKCANKCVAGSYTICVC